MTGLKEFQHFEQKPFIEERNVLRYINNMLTMFDIRDTTGVCVWGGGVGRGCNPCPFHGKSYLCSISDIFLPSLPKAY